jgi:hypothetical protein
MAIRGEFDTGNDFLEWRFEDLADGFLRHVPDLESIERLRVIRLGRQGGLHGLNNLILR